MSGPAARQRALARLLRLRRQILDLRRLELAEAAAERASLEAAEQRLREAWVEAFARPPGEAALLSLLGGYSTAHFLERARLRGVLQAHVAREEELLERLRDAHVDSKQAEILASRQAERRRLEELRREAAAIDEVAAVRKAFGASPEGGTGDRVRQR